MSAPVIPFEELAGDYDLWFENNRWAYLSELSAVERTGPVGRGLEVGVGTGRFAWPFSVSVGLDPSLPMLRAARKRGVTAVRGRAEDLPFCDEVFDFALLITTLCFVDDPLEALREARRVVRRDGLVLLGILDRESPLGMKYEQRAASSRFYRGARFFSASEARALLEKAGCRVNGIYQTLFSEPSGMTGKDPVLEGHGRGLFVVISALA
ncbi:MAG: class I SAM-dependent methyltransferase [Methanomassiliicoccales archaeon]|nr:class I SAM-dependent methyltransferase [Methanomassiliicoccales archaeon]